MLLVGDMISVKQKTYQDVTNEDVWSATIDLISGVARVLL